MARQSSVQRVGVVILCGAAAMLIGGCLRDSGAYPSMACDPPPELPCKPSITCVFKSNLDGRNYEYYVGQLNANLSFRIVFASLGGEQVTKTSGSSTIVPIGICVPQAANSKDVVGMPLQLGGELGTPIVCDVDDTGTKAFHFELKAGWAGLELFKPVGKPGPLGAPTINWFPIAWRMIASDGMRTGATSSKYYFAVIPKSEVWEGDRLCFADTGDVRAWPDEKVTGAPPPPPNGDKVPPWMLARFVPGVPRQDSKVVLEPVSPNDQDQFMAQARYFLEQVHKKHGM